MRQESKGEEKSWMFQFRLDLTWIDLELMVINIINTCGKTVVNIILRCIEQLWASEWVNPYVLFLTVLIRIS